MVESEGPARASGQETKSRIDAEHHTLRGLVRRVDEHRDLHTMIPLLTELRKLLEDHFAHEEEADGMADLVRNTIPHRMESVDQLFDEHREFLSDTDLLIERVQACLDGPMREVFERAHTLATALHDHEARETELLSDAMYEDEGGGD